MRLQDADELFQPLFKAFPVDELFWVVDGRF